MDCWEQCQVFVILVLGGKYWETSRFQGSLATQLSCLGEIQVTENPCLRKIESSGRSIPRVVLWNPHVCTRYSSQCLGIGCRFGLELVILFWEILETSGMVPHLENWVTEGMLLKGVFHPWSLSLVSSSLCPHELWSLCHKLQTLWYSGSPQGNMHVSKVNDRDFQAKESKSIIPLCKMFFWCCGECSRWLCPVWSLP